MRCVLKSRFLLDKKQVTDLFLVEGKNYRAILRYARKHIDDLSRFSFFCLVSASLFDCDLGVRSDFFDSRFSHRFSCLLPDDVLNFWRLY